MTPLLVSSMSENRNLGMTAKDSGESDEVSVSLSSSLIVKYQ